MLSGGYVRSNIDTTVFLESKISARLEERSGASEDGDPNSDEWPLARHEVRRLGKIATLNRERIFVAGSGPASMFGWGLLTGSTGSSSLPVGYTGQVRDATGLTYLRARYYNPAVGCFVSRDPLVGNPGVCQTLNRYAYATNDPATLIDPSGLKSQALGGRLPGLPCGPTLCVLGVLLELQGTAEVFLAITSEGATVGAATPGAIFLGAVGITTVASGGTLINASTHCSELRL
jgi:RHS repeat-associated protein